MASKSLSDLTPETMTRAKKIIEICENNGVELLIYCTLRSLREQAILFRQGRSWSQISDKINRLKIAGYAELGDLIEKVGPQHETKKVTNAGPGESWHNFGEAFDAVPIVGGKALWNDKVKYQVYGDSVVACGMNWAGNWKTFREFPHAQLRSGGNPLKVMSPDEISEFLSTGGV